MLWIFNIYDHLNVWKEYLAVISRVSGEVLGFCYLMLAAERVQSSSIFYCGEAVTPKNSLLSNAHSSVICHNQGKRATAQGKCQGRNALAWSNIQPDNLQNRRPPVVWHIQKKRSSFIFELFVLKLRGKKTCCNISVRLMRRRKRFLGWWWWWWISPASRSPRYKARLRRVLLLLSRKHKWPMIL